MENIYEFYNPVKTFVGADSIGQLKNILIDYEKILVIAWNKSIFNMSVINNLKQHKTIYELEFSYSNPTLENLLEAYDNSKCFDYDIIVAIGGGSVLDVAKTLACIKNTTIKSVDDIRNLINENNFKPVCPWIGVPTTFGTGSDVTCWATLWDVTGGKKLSVENTKNYALASIVDFKLGESMPKTLAITSALDAVAHATESYWAIKRNPTSKCYALTAIKFIMDALENLGGEQYMSQIAQGTMFAGLAFSNTKTTACHSISYPLTMYHNIPHGVAVSLLIGPMITLNKDEIEDTKSLEQAFGVDDLGEVELKIQAIVKKAGLPFALSEWGIGQSDLDFLADNGSTKGRIDNNPVKLNRDDILNILNKIF
ncbi:MAG: hypothetical protein ATN35_00780 [Epulopiscium sp. Nele67-Bin004]|nr:MAG: hypothetical protein ATN35_00780 [Epulopiscium sp. Nele67-Bin004]